MRSDGTRGRVRNTARVGGLTLTETIHPARMSIGPHTHPRATINFVLGGAYGEQVRGALDVYTAATVIVKPAGEEHANRFDGTGARSLLLELDASIVDISGSVPDPLLRPDIHGLGPMAGCVARMCAVLRHDTPPIAAQEAVERLLEHLSGRTRDMSGERPEWLRAVRDRIHATAPERLCLDELARGPGVHPAYLSQAFHRAFGKTISDYVEQLRLETAVRALTATGKTIGRIALEAGFYDHAHFTRVFRRATGVTPSAYRRAVAS